MKAEFLPEAVSDLAQSAAFYDGERAGLGAEFVREVLRVVDAIEAHPLAGSPMSPNSRRWLTKRFPYGVLYRLGHDEILIVAVMHLSREPNC